MHMYFLNKIFFLDKDSDISLFLTYASSNDIYFYFKEFFTSESMQLFKFL